MEKEYSEHKLFKTILKLVITGKAFALCPDCRKSLSMFEIYNENCSFCGELNFNDIVVKGIE